MKIAIVSRGLIRSSFGNDIYSFNEQSVQWCKENLDILKGCFGGHDITTFFCSWKSVNAENYAKNFDNCLLLKEPSKEESLKNLPNFPVWFRTPSHNCYHTLSVYKFFFQSRQIVTAVENSNIPFDYVVMTRPDMRLKIDDTKEWMDGSYCVPGMSYVNFNDHFGIAPAKMVYDVWKTSNNVLSNVVEISLDTEDVLKNIIKSLGISFNLKYNISQYFIKSFDVLAFYKNGGYERMKKELLHE